MHETNYETLPRMLQYRIILIVYAMLGKCNPITSCQYDFIMQTSEYEGLGQGPMGILIGDTTNISDKGVVQEGAQPCKVPLGEGFKKRKSQTWAFD